MQPLMQYPRPLETGTFDRAPLALQIADVRHAQPSFELPTSPTFPFGVMVSSTDADFSPWSAQLEIPDSKPQSIPEYEISIGGFTPDPFRELEAAGQEIITLTEENTALRERLFTAQIDLLDARIELYQKAKRENNLEYLAMHDEGTGLLNRRGLITALEQCLGQGQEPSLVIFFDITNLKRVNARDERGHEGGNYAILRYAQAILHAIRDDMDILARTGGDEMVAVIMANSGPRELREANTQRQVTTIRDRVGYAVEKFLQENPDLSYTDLAYGITKYDPTKPPHILFLEADQAAKADKDLQHKRKRAYRVDD